ncbi:MAG TPA: AMP-binding protein [Bacteroidota bacterium]|nr:AMP-binding protein [Bacteroidota bacterium]
MSHTGLPRTIYTLQALVQEAAKVRPGHTAIVEGNRRMTYAELADHSARFASHLLRSGIKRGDRVALYLPRSIDSVVALFGIWSAGAVGVVINDVLKSRQVNYILEHAEASLLLTDTRLIAAIEQPFVPASRTILMDTLAPGAGGADACPVIGNDLALIIYTSGSTGLPKGIMLSHTNLITGAYIIADYLSLTGDDILISLLPFSFDYGLNQLLTAVLVHGTLVIQRLVLPADICNALVREEVTGMAAVPMLWQQLAHSRSPFLKTAFPHLRYMTNTGGRMPEPIVKEIRRVHAHAELYLMFGLTEAFRSTFLAPEEADKRPTSIGKAIPNCEILLLNEHGEPCKPGETGELVHRGATVSLGYWKDPESTAKRFRPAPFQTGKGGIPEIAVYSGDFATMDEDGYIYFIGRRDQMIKSRGMRISPEEIEDCLFASGLVAHAVAFGIPKNEVETMIVAAVIPRNPAAFTGPQLVDYGKREMPEYMRPDVVWQLEQFPQTSTGKPDRVRIKELYLEHTKR